MTSFTIGQHITVTNPSMPARNYLLGLTGTVMDVYDQGAAVVQMDQDVTMHYMGTTGFDNAITFDPGECEITKS